MDQLALFDLPPAPWVFDPLERGVYSVVVADPPWRFATYSQKGKLKKSAERHYDTLTLEEIKALPVAELATPDCALVLWGTAPMLRESLDVMEAWGFEYKSHGIWGKLTVNGRLAFGTGYRIRNSHEIWLIGTRGNPKNTKGERSLLMAPLREHSRKPDEFYTMVERWMPNVRRADLFSRQSRLNWEGWGFERAKFDPPPLPHNQGEDPCCLTQTKLNSAPSIAPSAP
jgi:N6-adenosine-specific RNA methylase IME4